MKPLNEDSLRISYNTWIAFRCYILWQILSSDMLFYKESVVMRKEGATDFQIDWAKFDGQRKQYKEEADYAKEAGKIDDLVCYRALG